MGGGRKRESTTNLDIDFRDFLFLPKLSPTRRIVVVPDGKDEWKKELEEKDDDGSRRLIKVASRECKLNFFFLLLLPNWHADAVDDDTAYFLKRKTFVAFPQAKSGVIIFIIIVVVFLFHCTTSVFPSTHSACLLIPTANKISQLFICKNANL